MKKLTFLLIAAIPVFASAQIKIFDGTSLAGWKVVGGKATFTVENGEIIGTSVEGTPNSFLATEQEYADFVLDVDIRIDDTANNSGIMTRSHFSEELGNLYGRQVEADPSSRGWSGGIYDESRRGWLYPLSLNPAVQKQINLKVYNHYKIECIGNEMKTWINGQPAAYVIDTVDSKGFIALQVHSVKEGHNGMKTYFKNIRLQTENLKPAAFSKNIYVVNLTDNSLSAFEKAAGWKLLFDGKSPSGWKSAKGTGFPAKGWLIENGELSVAPSGGKESANGGDIVTTEKFSAFDLSFSFKLTAGANSGVKYFVTLQEQSQGSAIGLEYQVLDDSLHPDAKLGMNGNRTMASLYDLIKAEKTSRFIMPPGKWNRGRIVVHPNNRVEHYLNGIKVLEYTRGSKQFRELVANSKYKDWKNFGEAREGHILLQDHGDAVSYKNIRIRKL